MRRFEISSVNLLYLVMALLLVTAGSYMQSVDVRFGLIGTEVLLVLLPAVLFVWWTGESKKKVFRLKGISAKAALLVIVVTVLVYPAALLGNLIVVNILDFLGLYREINLPVASSMKEYAILLIVVSVSAGICEEIFFRGVLLRAYESWGHPKSILWTALLFGLFHFNLQNLVAPVILGLLFGYLVVLTDSIYAGIIAHMTNNALAVTIGFLNAMGNSRAPAQEAAEAAVSAWDMVTAIAVIALIASVCLLLAFRLIGILKGILRKDSQGLMENARQDEETLETAAPKAKDPWWGFLPLAVVFAMYVFLMAAII